MKRHSRIKGTDGRYWILVEWVVIYGENPVAMHKPYRNYVPEDEDAAVFLLNTYGPWSIGNMQGRVEVQ
jgi:hypothetical protein